MGAFDPLFRSSRFSRRTPVMPGARRGGLGMLGLAGIGYGIYRFLQTERGRAVQGKVMDQVRGFGERVRRPETTGNEATF